MSYPAPTAVETYSGSSRTERRSSPDVVKQSQRSVRLAWIWRRVRLQALAALGAAVVGIVFGYLVVRRGYLFAGNDLAMQTFFSVTVGIGLFPLFSARASQGHRKKRKRARSRP
jgi:hypothetical protein